MLLGRCESKLLPGPFFLCRRTLAEFLNRRAASPVRHLLRRFTGLLHLLFIGIEHAGGPVCLPRFDFFRWEPPLLLEILDVVQAVLRVIHDPDLVRLDDLKRLLQRRLVRLQTANEIDAVLEQSHLLAALLNQPVQCVQQIPRRRVLLGDDRISSLKSPLKRIYQLLRSVMY